MRNYFFVYVLIFFFVFSCKKTGLTKQEKYRIKNPVETINIYINEGVLNLATIFEDVVDINIEKVLYSNISGDFIFINEKIEYDDKKFECNIRINKGENIDGKVNATIIIPATVRYLNISSKRAKLNLTEIYSNLFIENFKGTSFVEYRGAFLQIVQNDGDINVLMDTMTPLDSIVSNDYGNININFENISKDSFLNIKSINNNINFKFNKHIDYDITMISNIQPYISSTYNKRQKYFFDENRFFIKNGNNPKISINIKSNKGYLTIK